MQYFQPLNDRLDSAPKSAPARRPNWSLHGWTVACLVAVLATVASTAWSQPAPAPGTSSSAVTSTGPIEIDATGRFESEVQACKTGKTPQARETCLREAHSAQAERRAGRLANVSNGPTAANGSTPQLTENALQRCAVFKGEEKSACEARIAGVGTTRGSVAGGGVIREVETITVPAESQK